MWFLGSPLVGSLTRLELILIDDIELGVQGPGF